MSDNSQTSVPREGQNQVFRLAHSSLTSGHFSHRMTTIALKRMFMWPGIGRMVHNWCSQCPVCQKGPLQPLPVIQTPFYWVAFELVGPRTTRGNKYILTCICLASKYLEAIPLRRVDAISSRGNG